MRFLFNLFAAVAISALSAASLQAEEELLQEANRIRKIYDHPTLREDECLLRLAKGDVPCLKSKTVLVDRATSCGPLTAKGALQSWFDSVSITAVMSGRANRGAAYHSGRCWTIVIGHRPEKKKT